MPTRRTPSVGECAAKPGPDNKVAPRRAGSRAAGHRLCRKRMSPAGGERGSNMRRTGRGNHPYQRPETTMSGKATGWRFGRGGARGTAHRAAVRLAVEGMEDRVMPSVTLYANRLDTPSGTTEVLEVDPSGGGVIRVIPT